jgi:glycosyltransferase involved in cell wall biosynthesis
MKISLVMATKNAAHVKDYIGQALSIAPLFDEVIVHSNCYASNIWIPQYRNMIILFEDTPISCPDALNKAVGQATGDWILPLCDDDFCKPNLLEHLIFNLREGLYSNKDVVWSAYLHGNERDGWILYNNAALDLESLRDHNSLPFTSFYKKSAWSEIGGYKNYPFNDWLFWLELLKAKKQFVYHEPPYLYFRQGHVLTPALSAQEAQRLPFAQTRKILLDYLETSHEGSDKV